MDDDQTDEGENRAQESQGQEEVHDSGKKKYQCEQRGCIRLFRSSPQLRGDDAFVPRSRRMPPPLCRPRSH